MIDAITTRPTFKHLAYLTTSHGLYEHALLSEPRQEHGYCVDDVARALVLLCRESEHDSVTHPLLDIYLNFTLGAITERGSRHNRMNVEGLWTDEPGNGDWWGRAMWALGVSAVHAPEEQQRIRALAGFRIASQTTSPHFMAMTFAALGAGELLLAFPAELAARKVLRATQRMFALPLVSSDWLWPQPRLRYSNGSIAEAAMLTGWALGDDSTLNWGVRMLDFLLDLEINGEHLSVTPVGGRGPGELKPGFDQQPIEVAALADACARAWAVTGNSQWRTEIKRAWNWFLGGNDVGAEMFDPGTGGGYDGLQISGPNLNQGAESTIAMLSTAQHAYLLGTVS